MKTTALCAILLLAAAALLGTWADGIAGDRTHEPLGLLAAKEEPAGAQMEDDRSGWYWGHFRLFPGADDLFNRKVYAATLSFIIPGLGQWSNASGNVGKGVAYIAGNAVNNAILGSTDEEDVSSATRIFMSPTNVLLNRLVFEPKETATDVLLLAIGLAVAGSSAYDAHQNGRIGPPRRVQITPAAKGAGLALHLRL